MGKCQDQGGTNAFLYSSMFSSEERKSTFTDVEDWIPLLLRCAEGLVTSKWWVDGVSYSLAEYLW